MKEGVRRQRPTALAFRLKTTQHKHKTEYNKAQITVVLNRSGPETKTRRHAVRRVSMVADFASFHP